jgi:hypothetical protein
MKLRCPADARFAAGCPTIGGGGFGSIPNGGFRRHHNYMAVID